MKTLHEIFPSANSRLKFLKGLIMLAKSDGSIDIEEEEYFFNAAVSLGLNVENVIEVKASISESKDGDLPVFEDQSQTIFFLKEAVHLCFLDGKYTNFEKDFLTKVAIENSITHRKLEEIENWVREGQDWIKRGDKLLEVA